MFNIWQTFFPKKNMVLAGYSSVERKKAGELQNIFATRHLVQKTLDNSP
jgi:hypothetical protein